VLRFVERRGLGDLQIEPGEITAQLLRPFRDRSFFEFAWRQIHIQPDVLPSRRILKRALHHPRIESPEVRPIFGPDGDRFTAADLAASPSGPQERLGRHDSA
jgi:hypothetical protein